jgi:hypothetical protein
MSWIYTLIFSGLIAGVGGDAAKLDTTTASSLESQVVSVVSETKRIEKSFPLPANGRLGVANVNGSIDLKAWDNNEVQVVATITADSKERLEDVEVVFNSKPDSLDIETDYGNWNRGSGGNWNRGGNASVSYVIMAPRGAVLNDIETVNGSVTVADFTNIIKSSAVNGSVRATNIRGTASLETVNGELYAEFERLDSAGKIALNTVNGRVNLVLPSDANATIKADSLNGNITNDFGLPVRKGKYVGRDMYGKLGRGEVYIKLESVNGTLNVSRRNDGKQLSPAVDLLPQKGKDDDDSDFDVDIADFDAAVKSAAKAQKEIAKGDRATARASAEMASRIAATAPELARMGIEAAKLEAEKAKLAASAIDLKSMEKLKVDLEKIAVTMPEFAVANYSPSMPRIVRQSNTFSVKGKPDVVVEANGVDVRVIGWDEPTVKYSLLEIANSRSRENITVGEEKSDSKVKLTIEGAAGVRPAGMRIGSRLVIYVPRKSDLKVTTDGEIRVEGVSGKLEVEGGEQSVNLRDIKGELNVTSTEGSIRVVGFDGKLTASSESGLLSLEGKFDGLDARSDSGEIVVTLPADSNANITAYAEKVRSEGIELKGSNVDDKYLVGKGGNVFTIETGKTVLVRSTESITTSQ